MNSRSHCLTDSRLGSLMALLRPTRPLYDPWTTRGQNDDDTESAPRSTLILQVSSLVIISFTDLFMLNWVYVQPRIDEHSSRTPSRSP